MNQLDLGIPTECASQQQHTQSLHCSWNIVQEKPNAKPESKSPIHFKNLEIIQGIFSNHTTRKREINNRRKIGNSQVYGN